MIFWIRSIPISKKHWSLLFISYYVNTFICIIDLNIKLTYNLYKDEKDICINFFLDINLND